MEGFVAVDLTGEGLSINAHEKDILLALSSQ